MARPVVSSRYYSGQGIVMMGERDGSGNPQGLVPIGNVPELTLTIELTEEEHKESWSGQRGIDDTLTTETNVTLSIIMESISAENLILGLNGTSTATPATSASDYQLQVFHDKWSFLPELGISNVVVGDDAVPTTTYVEDTDYEVDPEGGAIKALSTGSIVDAQVVFVDYDHSAIVNVQALVTDNPERYFVFNGLNTKDNLPVRLEIYRLQTQPFADFGFINDAIAQFTVEARALADENITQAGQSKFFQEILQTA